MKIEPDLRAAFMAAAEADHRPASQIVRELMRDFITRQEEARSHHAFLQTKVDAARRSIREEGGRSGEEVEAAFAARRAGIASDA